MYYVISAGADGVHISEYTKKQLENLLIADGFLGESRICATFPKETDVNYWGDRLVIIKGEVVMPQAVQIVQVFELP